jgi:hypothetical protein
MAEARTAASGRGCAGFPAGAAASPRVSTADGVTWQSTMHDALLSHEHGYLAQADERVALLRVNQIDADSLHNATDDATVLAEMREALER